jgi:hypothetical protein
MTDETSQLSRRCLDNCLRATTNNRAYSFSGEGTEGTATWRPIRDCARMHTPNEAGAA